jgi:hypothetical protein
VVINDITNDKKTMKKILLMSVFVFFANHSFSQGCSDAGFCTLESFKPNTNDSIKQLKNQFKIGAFFGGADNSIAVYGNYLEYNRQFSSKFGLDLKITTLAQNGNYINTFGLADAFLNANYKASDKLKFTLGAKIPFNNADNSKNNLPLPMDYQASLGTFDLILGLGFQINKFQIATALQQPLTQNENRFFASSYPLNSTLRTFQSTNKFKRSGDVMVRVSYPLTLNQKLKLTPSLLPIYHLANDKYTDELNIEREIIGSDGLTLNGTFFLDYEINTKNSLQLNLGMPFVIRDVRPDGLTRSFVANLEYRIKF